MNMHILFDHTRTVGPYEHGPYSHMVHKTDISFWRKNSYSLYGNNSNILKNILTNTLRFRRELQMHGYEQHVDVSI